MKKLGLWPFLLIASGVLLAQEQNVPAQTPSDPIDLLGWAAVIGAAAWIPILWQWLERKLSKPILDVVIGNIGEVGYNTTSTILNLQVAIRARKKPALVTSLQLHLTHENGRRINLRWNSLSEVLSRAESTTGDVASYTRDVPATAVQVLPNSDVVHQKVLCNDVDEQIKANDLSGALAVRLDRAQNATEAQVRQMDEYVNLQDHYREGYPWEAGRYSGELQITVHELKNPVVEKFSFEMTNGNVNHLRTNLQLIETQVRNIALNNDVPRPSFNFINLVVRQEH